MSYEAEVVIEALPPMANELFRGDWRKRAGRTRQWKALVAIHFAKLRPERPLETARLTLTRASSQRPDDDGLVSGFKAIIDGLVECGVIVNDDFKVLGRTKYEWAKCPPGKGHVIIRIEAP